VTGSFDAVLRDCRRHARWLERAESRLPDPATAADFASAEEDFVDRIDLFDVWSSRTGNGRIRHGEIQTFDRSGTWMSLGQ
jgi:hypothetical protein